MVPPPFLKKLSAGLAIASAMAILVSIPASQILLALALAVLLLSGLPLRWPRIARPLALFLIWTLISLAASPDPVGGLTQVRKMVVFLVLLVVYSSVRTFADARVLMAGMAAVGTIGASRGIFQFARKVLEARAQHREFYEYYLDSRITGFQSHWMTFSGQELYLLLLLAAFLLFGAGSKRIRWIAGVSGVAMLLALVMTFTRGVWIAAVPAGFYLLWNWKRRAALLMPVIVAVLLLFAPASMQKRVVSLVHPEKQTDSNEHRFIVWTVGWEMIKAHPLLGVGPEEISKDSVFQAYLPKSISRDLPPGDYKHLHSIYIHYAAERGIPAALILTASLLMALYDFRRALTGLPPGRSDRRFILQWASATVIGTLVVGVTDLNLGLTDELTVFLTVMCLGYLAVELTEPGQ